MSIFELWLVFYSSWKLGLNFTDTITYFEHSKLSAELQYAAFLSWWKNR